MGRITKLWFRNFRVCVLLLLGVGACAPIHATSIGVSSVEKAVEDADFIAKGHLEARGNGVVFIVEDPVKGGDGRRVYELARIDQEVFLEGYWVKELNGQSTILLGQLMPEVRVWPFLGPWSLWPQGAVHTELYDKVFGDADVDQIVSTVKKMVSAGSEVSP